MRREVGDSGAAAVLLGAYPWTLGSEKAFLSLAEVLVCRRLDMYVCERSGETETGTVMRGAERDLLWVGEGQIMEAM
jgi:hypothetical protein